MRRLGRILINAATALSLVLCAATVVLWARSYHGDGGILEFGDRRWGWFSRDGELGVNDAVHQFEVVMRAMGIDPTKPMVGQKFHPVTLSNVQMTQYALPYWLIFIATACLPFVRWRSTVRKRKATRRGLCPACGYDLRATPDRCPECGATPAPSGT